MSQSDDAVTGGCQCGAVRYRLVGEPVNSNYCHCESCRRHAGAPVVALVGFPADRIVFTGQARKAYRSSPGVNRTFCPSCGTPLTWEGEGADGPLVEVLTATLDDPGRFPPTDHFNYGERIAWFDTADHLPRYRAFDDEPAMSDAPAGISKE